MDKYDSLKLENQLCFPLYACSKEITRRYKPFLSKLDLTYTQYITMMVLWEKRELSVKELGDKLIIKITDQGMALREKALSVPQEIRSCVSLTDDEASTLFKLLHSFMNTIEQ